MKELIGFLLYLAMWVFGLFLWLYAIIADAKADRILWVLVDILVAPIGVIRGMILWL